MANQRTISKTNKKILAAFDLILSKAIITQTKVKKYQTPKPRITAKKLINSDHDRVKTTMTISPFNEV